MWKVESEVCQSSNQQSIKHKIQAINTHHKTRHGYKSLYVS